MTLNLQLQTYQILINDDQMHCVFLILLLLYELNSEIICPSFDFFRNRGCVYRGKTFFQQFSGNCVPIGTKKIKSLPFQKRHGNMQLQLHIENPRRQNEPCGKPMFMFIWKHFLKLRSCHFAFGWKHFMEDFQVLWWMLKPCIDYLNIPEYCLETIA